MTDLNEALIDTSCILRPTGCSTISSVSDLSQLTPTQIEVLRRNPFVYDSLLIGQGGRALGQQDRAELRAQHGRQPDLPEHREAADRVDRSRGARRQHAVLQAARRGDLLLPPSAADLGRLPRTGRVHLAGRRRTGVPARSSSACSWAASTASAASTSGPSGRACRDRSSCSAATRACCSTPST